MVSPSPWGWVLRPDRMQSAVEKSSNHFLVGNRCAERTPNTRGTGRHDWDQNQQGAKQACLRAGFRPTLSRSETCETIFCGGLARRLSDWIAKDLVKRKAAAYWIRCGDLGRRLDLDRCSENPDQGVQPNSTWPTLPFGEVAKHCFGCASRALWPRLVVFSEAET